MLLKQGLVDLGEDGCARADVLVRGGSSRRSGPRLDAADGDVLDCSDFLVVPGMVNAHAHSNEAWFRGMFETLPLELWELGAYPVIAAPRQSAREIYVRTLLNGMETIRSGATCVADFLYELPTLSLETLDPVVRAYRDLGLRALIVLGIADRPFLETVELDEAALDPSLRNRLEREVAPSWPESELLIREAVAAYHRPQDGLSIAAGPSGPQRCSDEMLEALPALADELDLRVHTHLLETRMQAVVGRRLYGTKMTEHLRKIGFLNERVSLAHAIWVDRADIRLLTEAGCTVIHNPLSNMKLGSGSCPIPAYLSEGTCVALGSDGTASADGADMFLTLRAAALTHTLWGDDYERWPQASDVWRMATRGGARAVGDRRLGRLAAGSPADIVLLDLRSRFFTPLNDPLRNLVFSGASEAVHSVMIGGRWVLRAGALLTVDEADVLGEARETGASVIGRHQLAFAQSEGLRGPLRRSWLTLLDREFDDRQAWHAE